MVKRRVRQMYVDEDFYNLCSEFKGEVKKSTDQRVGNPFITRGITQFLYKEKIVPIMVRRVKGKKRIFL